MARAFLVVMDSLGIGGAPDAAQFFNAEHPDAGANTLAHIAHSLPGGLHLPHLDRLGLGAALTLASGEEASGLGETPQGLWGAATAQSPAKDTISGHWELAGLPMSKPWYTFPRTRPAFPEELIIAVSNAARSGGLLGNRHGSGTEIIQSLGPEHMKWGWPICYTSADSVFQVAAHEETYGLDRLLSLCETIAPILHSGGVARVIARPFTGNAESGFTRTTNRRDFSIPPPLPTLCDWAQEEGRSVHAIGKIGDIFSMQGMTDVQKGDDAALMAHLSNAIRNAPEGSLTFANFVEFDTLYGHQRDPKGYADALTRFDAGLGGLLEHLKEGDLLLLTADHGNDPTWIGTDHTRERVPVLAAGVEPGEIGHVRFVDVAASVADHLGLSQHGPGTSFLP